MQNDFLENIKQRNYAEGQRLDLKHHCQAILQSIEKFDNQTAHRAIWELVQNARDLSEHAHVQFRLEGNKLHYKHNGDPFTYGNLSALVRQVSSSDKENNEKAGQFGTGFMTTHKFGRKIYINGSYEIYEGHYVNIDNFCLDRSATEISDMCIAMEKQIKAVDDLLGHEESCKREWTEFIYELDTPERYKAAKDGILVAEKLMPYAMIFNPEIEKCTISIENDEPIYYHKTTPETLDDLQHITIYKNDAPTDYYYLQSEDGDDIIVLPLISSTEARLIDPLLPHIFIYFPLLGAEHWNINFIFHSRCLYPNEPRSLYLMDLDNADIAHKVQVNRHIIERMQKRLFAFLREHASTIKNGIYMAPLGFMVDPSVKFSPEVFDAIHDAWVEEFKQLPLIEKDGALFSLGNGESIRVLDPKIIDFLKDGDNKVKYLDVIYEYAQLVAPLPDKEDVIRWTEIIDVWDREHNHPQWYITVEDIVNQIVQKQNFSQLHQFLLYLKDSNQKDYFYSHPMILNREGEPCTQNNLRGSAEIIPSNLYSVIKPLIPNFAKKMVSEEFEDVCDFIQVTRDDLRSNLSDYVNCEKRQQPLDDISEDYIKTMIPFCLTFPTSNPNVTERYAAMNTICSHYQEPFNVNIVPYCTDSDKEQNMYNIVFDWLVECEFRLIEQMAYKNPEWYSNQENASYLYNLITALSNKDRPTRHQLDIMPKYKIFPNQNGVLCKAGNLCVFEQEIDHPYEANDINQLFELSNSVLQLNQKDKFVDDIFKDVCAFINVKPKNICAEIWEKLDGNHQAHKNEIVSIIATLDDSQRPVWKYWFNELDVRKAQLLLDCIPSTQRNDVFTLMKIEESRLRKLAELTNESNWEEIITCGRSSLLEQQERERDYQRMLQLGKCVERLLRIELQSNLQGHQLDISLQDPEILDYQGGQDIVIRVNDKDIYYIEVKSHWAQNAKEVWLTPSQLERAVLENAHYALCYVDMSWKDSDKIDFFTNEELETFVQKARVLTDIGGRSVECYSVVQSSVDAPYIGSDYRLVVPLSIFENGNAHPFAELVGIIKKEIISQG